MEGGMVAHIPIGRCCFRPRFNAVGGLDERVWPYRLGPTLLRKLRSIAADIAGDREAVERVELVLPETGVCNRSAAPDADNCRGGPALSAVDACCAADANAKQQGKTACGCVA
jgi:hypothetical protein